MKNWLLLIGLLCLRGGISQEGETPELWTLDATPFYGSILLHNTDISHLIRKHPSGIILGFSKQTFGHKGWEGRFNYPDTGVSLVYQDMNNGTLGVNLGVYLHYNFYLLNRNLQFRIGQGVAYNTNPYDKEENFRNNAYGTHLMSSTFLVFNYLRPNLFRNLGVKAGISLIHYSNANVKAPNTSTNTFAFNAGVVYDLKGDRQTPFLEAVEEPIEEPVRLNLVFRTGINESDVINSGQFPFYILSAYADKRLGRLSAIQLGAEVFYSNFLKELIRFQSISFPELNVDGDTDFKRVGLFLGHELFIDKLSVITQLGYYVYYPFDFEGQVYNRVGVKRYFGDRWFAALSLKSHAAKAEAVELGIGIRL
ncbi:Lipid A 3-O-deacylase (PagL) [Muriicola jejuensis]|uniref:Acyloxyacyl hydrolase n=1 Tax=Muriicola jejuensis TaxID=504488 RepID=A0A6P0U8C3_9FLAO|nr:acyloxyacyl hydrolase [Muriicola jejuensis]NER09387.1 acyloxyacyl hydrolase [Muriicola jejuensis]SMP08935.1 Lipid A 3-O-deacylase (PagL) [Muriicola jejuensis]